MKRSGLSRIENHVREIVEGSFGRLLGGNLEPLEVVNQLINAIEGGEAVAGADVQYQIALNPEDLRMLGENRPDFEALLSDAAQQLGMQMGINGSAPVVRLIADPDLKPRKMRISAISLAADQEVESITQTYHAHRSEEDLLREMYDRDAFLIVQGRRHIPLNKPVIALGRRTENDVVLDLPSVSRQHAQIRWRYGNFVIYDVSSRGRTLVNGHYAHERMLRPGDVIALGEALIVYGEGIGGASKSGENKAEDHGTLARLPNKR